MYNLDYSVLRDQTILPALQVCEENVAKHQSILDEATYVRDTLEQKRVPYVTMAHQVATLYALVRKMTVLHPLYYLPFEQFTEIFTQVLHTRDRGKGVAGESMTYLGHVKVGLFYPPPHLMFSFRELYSCYKGVFRLLGKLDDSPTG